MIETAPRMTRVWAMPNADTFDVPPIREFVRRYLRQSRVSIDPFARNKRWATYTNDLNPDTAAEYHMDAVDFLNMLARDGVTADLVLFDPPYSPRQIQEVYQQIGKTVTAQDTQNSVLYSKARDAIRSITIPDSVVLSFGWNSAGMGPGWELIELVLITHGGAHNDTICMAERKVAHQPALFSQVTP